MSLFAELRDPGARRSKSARKLAAFILADPETVISMPIAALAAAVGVSEPTVNRFCTSLGLKGFPDFKLTLAAELGRERPAIARGVESGDNSAQVAAKLFESTHAGLAKAQRNLDPGSLEAVVEALDSARSIVLCGLGASASVALDAQHKLLRFDMPVLALADIVNQRVQAATLLPGDCLLCISYTGRTSAMVELAELGAESGATVIGLTAPDSPLARRCERVLGVESSEDTDAYTPMTSRLAQLVIIDILATCMALRRGPDFDRQLRRVKRSLAATRDPD